MGDTMDDYPEPDNPYCGSIRGGTVVGHYRKRCVCGNWLGQCRCTKKDKEIKIVDPCICKTPNKSDELESWQNAAVSVISAPVRQTVSVVLEKYGYSPDQKRMEFAFYDERGELQHGLAINLGAYRLLGEPDQITVQISGSGIVSEPTAGRSVKRG